MIVRVHHRIEDLEVCLEVLRTYWTSFPYHVVVVSNGLAEGHVVSRRCRELADEVVELSRNAGHNRGNSQLLLAGLPRVPADCDYTVLLEADTWIFSDRVVAKYVELMRRSNAVWASAEWIERYESLAVDFAIAETGFLRSRPEILDFTEHAECHVSNELARAGGKSLYITECMPTHVPRLLRLFHNPYGGRNRTFRAARMITHHVEDLRGGITEKKSLANVMLGRREFDVPGSIGWERLKLSVLEALIRGTPRSRWVRPRRRRELRTSSDPGAPGAD